MVEAQQVNESMVKDKFFPKNKKALVVGICNYDQCQTIEGEGKLGSLTHPYRDAKAMEEFLRGHDYDVTIIIQENKGDHVKAQKVHDVLKQFLAEANKNNLDSIEDPMHYFIYFSGHGCISDDTAFTSGIDSEGNLIWFEYYALLFSSITDCLVFTLLDCCRKKSSRTQFTDDFQHLLMPKDFYGISVLKFSCIFGQATNVRTSSLLSKATELFLERAKGCPTYHFKMLQEGFDFPIFYAKKQMDWGLWYLFSKEILNQADLEEKEVNNMADITIEYVNNLLQESLNQSRIGRTIDQIDLSVTIRDEDQVNPQDKKEEGKIIEGNLLETIHYEPKISNSFKFGQHIKTMKVILKDEDHIIVAGEQKDFYLFNKEMNQVKTKTLKLKEVKCAILIEGYAYFAIKHEQDNRSEMGIEVFKVTDLDNGGHFYFKTGSIVAKMLILSEGVLLCAGVKGLIEFADYYKCKMLTYNPDDEYSKNIRFQLKDVSLLLDIQKTQNTDEFAIITMERLIFSTISSHGYDCYQIHEFHKFDDLIRGFLHIKDDQYAFFFYNKANLFIYDRSKKALILEIVNYTNSTGFISMRFLQNMVDEDKLMNRYLILKDQEGLSLFDLHENKSVKIQSLECLNMYYEENALCSFLVESQQETIGQPDFHFKILTIENDKIGNQNLIELSLYKPELMI